MPGTLELSSPALVVPGLGGLGGSYRGAEVFSDEIATLLNDHSVYRESSYQIFFQHSPMKLKCHQYIFENCSKLFD